MRASGRSLVIVVSVVIFAGLVVLVLYQPDESEVYELNQSLVSIGFIEMWDNYTRIHALFEAIIEPEVNRYAEEIGADIRFNYTVVHADNSPDSLDRVKEFNESGCRYVIGSNCVACVAYHYVLEHDMMLVSSRSRQSLFHIEDEHMFRVCPHDGDQGIAIARVLESRNISRVAVLRRDCGWAGDVFNAFSEEYSGEVLVDVRYAGESIEFSKELAKVESAINETGSSGTGLLVLSYAEIEAMFEQAAEYSVLFDVPWFGVDATVGLDESTHVDSIEGFEKVGLYSVSHTVEYGEKWDWLASSFLNVTGVYPETRIGYDYDAAWLYALTLLETDSFNRSVLAETMPVVGAGYCGATGFVGLDEAGDRVNACYDVWGYVVEDGVTVCSRVGYFDGSSGVVVWLG
jgi:ABC-type branched-subunit amino acid transport system substrate-binding protein